MKKKSHGKNQLNNLDSKHQAKLDFFDENPDKIKKLNREKKTLENQLSKINGLDYSEYNQEIIEQKAQILLKIKDIEKEIDRIDNNIDEALYYNDTIDYLMPYYNKKSEKSAEKKVIQFNNFFKKTAELDTKNKKSELFKNYLIATENIQKKTTKKTRFKPRICSNKNCDGNELILHLREGYLVCTKCGEREEILLDSDKPNYKEPSQDSSAYSYKRINHLNESKKWSFFLKHLQMVYYGLSN